MKRAVKNGWMRVDVPGATMEDWDFTGTMIVSVPDVTICRSDIRPRNGSRVPPIWLKPGADNFTLADSKVLPPADEKITAPSGIMMVDVDGAVIRDTLMTGTIDGIKLAGSELTVRDTDIVVPFVAGSHHDGIQVQASARPTHLTLQKVDIKGPGSPEGNSAVFAKKAHGWIEATDVCVEGFGWAFQARDGRMHVRFHEGVECESNYGPIHVEGGATWS